MRIAKIYMSWEETDMKTLTKFALIFVLLILACTSGQSKQPKAEKVYRIVYEARSNDWYQAQAELWKKEIDRDPGNTEAWYNYYNANRYAHFENIDSKAKKAKLDQIIDAMGKAIPGTYEYYLLSYWNSYNFEDLSLVEKAYALDSMRADTYYPFISSAEINNNTEQFNKFCRKLYQAQDISAWLLEYNYNVLMSLEPDAILFTNGDNDTYPVWLLQNVKQIRPDVMLINISMATIEKYITRKLSERGIDIDYKTLFKSNMDKEANPKKRFIQNLYHFLADKYPDQQLYFALTVYNNFIDDIRDQLYVTGLAYRFSPDRIDNLALIRKNMGKRFRLDYLEHDWYRETDLGQSIKERLHLNYVVPMVMLAEHYQASGDTENALKWKNMAMQLAEQAENAEVITEIKTKLPDLL